ncbi:uncharacterized protein LOC132515629 [Lagenorhynchus albirostris]|uniref:uncharacterized protein LOC132515629 n=1 Tax=Lagenorhynchus albirostris TaxID=27610 RepID=UPI0028EFC418|nr:uncharacterized protein LOC132515629 [Lagenorhynchus albirostris]
MTCGCGKADSHAHAAAPPDGAARRAAQTLCVTDLVRHGARAFRGGACCGAGPAAGRGLLRGGACCGAGADGGQRVEGEEPCGLRGSGHPRRAEVSDRGPAPAWGPDVHCCVQTERAEPGTCCDLGCVTSSTGTSHTHCLTAGPQFSGLRNGDADIKRILCAHQQTQAESKLVPLAAQQADNRERPVAANGQWLSRPLCHLGVFTFKVEEPMLLKAHSLLTSDVRVGKQPGPGDCKHAARGLPEAEAQEPGSVWPSVAWHGPACGAAWPGVAWGFSREALCADSGSRSVGGQGSGSPAGGSRSPARPLPRPQRPELSGGPRAHL